MQKAILSIIILTIIAMSAVFANAAQVTLTWDANDPAPTGYRIYTRTGADYGAFPVWEGTATTCTITVPDGVETAFVARAYVVGQLTGALVESGNSNEVAYLSKPEPPKNLVARLVVALKQWFKGLFA
jgi:chitinase